MNKVRLLRVWARVQLVNTLAFACRANPVRSRWRFTAIVSHILFFIALALAFSLVPVRCIMWTLVGVGTLVSAI